MSGDGLAAESFGWRFSFGGDALMQALKRFLEWYFGVPAAEPGQGTAWNFSGRPPWPEWLPPWAVLLLAAGVVGLVAWVYLRDARSASRRARLGLIGLRLAVVAVALLFLSGVSLTIDRTGLPVVAVLIDDSASMGFEDQYGDGRIQQAAQSLQKTVKEARPTRLNLATALLTGDDARFLKQLQSRYKLRVYRFSETAVAVGRGEYLQDDDLADLVPRLKALSPEGEQTRPGAAVRKVLDDLRGTPPAAVILLTDGITTSTEADRLSGVVDLARSRLVPIYAVGLGSEEPVRDIQLYDVLVDEVAFVDDPIAWSGKIKAWGYEGTKVRITLRQKNTTRALAETQVVLPGDGESARFELIYAPPQEGEFDYVVEATPLRNESDDSNNLEQRTVSVRREKIRVLLADFAPRYEFRYVKQLLERDKTVELHTVLQDADLEYADEDRTAIGHFPVRREDLFEYDVVILGDVDPTLLGPSALGHLRDFVRDAGGGLITIAGPRHNPLAFRGTPLETMLPVRLEDAEVPPADMTITERYRPELTLAGRKGSSIFRFAENELQSLAVWKEFEPLYWLVEAPHLQPGAEVLAEHPTRTGSDGRLPVIALQRFGAGKVLFHATDDLWRWRFRTGDLYYGRYWVQAIRYLCRSKLLGRDRSAVLDTDRADYRSGDTVVLRLRFFDDQQSPLEKDGVTVMVERRGDVQRPLTLTRLPQAPTIFEGQLPRAAEGDYHAWVVTPSFKSAPPAKDFVVHASQRERQERSQDRADLQQTAKLTHGKYYTLADAEQLPGDLPQGQAVPLETQEPILLWNRWELLLLFAGLLTAEWLWRKRLRLV